MRALSNTALLVILLTTSTAALAEVADKEPTIFEMWIWSLAIVIIVLVAGWWKRTVGIALWLMGALASFGTILEWHDPYVGPAIAHELGQQWGWHAYASTLFVVIVPALFLLANSLRERAKPAE